MDNSYDPFIHSPIGTITVSGENSGATPFSLRHSPTSLPAPPGRPQSSSVHTTPPPHSKRVRAGGSPAVKERTPLFTAHVLVANRRNLALCKPRRFSGVLGSKPP